MGKKENMNKRVKNIRKALGMTQQEFADKIRFKTGNTLSMIERNENNVNDQHVDLICAPNRFKDGITVSEKYLRAGIEPMFLPRPTPGELEIFDKNNKLLPRDQCELVDIYRKLDPPNKEIAIITIDGMLKVQEAGKGEILEADKGRA